MHMRAYVTINPATNTQKAKEKQKKMEQQQQQEDFIERIDWELSYREKWPMDRFGVPIFPRPTDNDESLPEEERLKRSAIHAVRAVANMIPGWNFPVGFVETLYEQLEDKSGDFKTLVNQMGDLAKWVFFRRHRTCHNRRCVDGTLIRADAADRFIRRLDWHTSFEKRQLYDVNGIPVY